MAIVKYKNQSGITYAYESISEWDPVKKQSRPKRKYLGRVDLETGEIISTKGKRGRPKKRDDTATETSSVDTDYQAMYKACAAELKSSKEQIRLLEQTVHDLSVRKQELENAVASIYQTAGTFLKEP